MAAPTLYSISEELTTLSDSLDMCMTDDDREECIERIATQKGLQQDKVDHFARFLALLESQANLAATEIDRLKERERRLTRLRKDLERYALRVMEVNEQKKLEGETSSLHLRKNMPSVQIEYLDKVPAEFKTQTILVTADKPKIRQAIERGEEVPGAHLHYGTSLIRR